VQTHCVLERGFKVACLSDEPSEGNSDATVLGSITERSSKSHLIKLHLHPQKPTSKSIGEMNHSWHFLVATGDRVTTIFEP
jgi:hypothetical protein